MQVSGSCWTGSSPISARKSFAISPSLRIVTLLFFAPPPDVLRRALQPGDILLLYTGTWNRFAGDKRYLTDFAGLGESAAEWIVRRQVKTFGVDSPTPDNPASTSYPVHMMCRREHITHYENLANLDQVVNTRFTFAGFPLKLRGAHGGPTRAVALVG